MPGGVVIPLPDTALRSICRELPDLPIEIIKSVAIHYQLERDHNRQAPSDVEKVLQKIAEASATLYGLLGTLSEEARNALWDEVKPEWGVSFVEQLEWQSRAMIGLARNAALAVDVSKGRPSTPRHALIRRYAALLTAHGRQADQRSKGDLCFLTETVLKGLGEKVGDVRSLVRDALAKNPA